MERRGRCNVFSGRWSAQEEAAHGRWCTDKSYSGSVELYRDTEFYRSGGSSDSG